MSKILGQISGFIQTATEQGVRKTEVFLGFFFVTLFFVFLFVSHPIRNASASIEIYSLASSAPIPSRKPASYDRHIVEVAMALPKELNFEKHSRGEKDQIKIAREIFSLQSQENIVAASKLLKKLRDKDLRGHILAQRYLDTRTYVSSPKELEAWLKHYKDFPQARDIYRLAERKGATNLTKPIAKKTIKGNVVTESYRAKIYQSRKQRTKAQTSEYFDLKNKIETHVQVKEPTQALNLLNQTRYEPILDDVEYDRLRTEIAAGYLYANRLKHASRLAAASLKRSGEAVPQAGWIKGLVKWQEGKYLSAAKAFEVTANSPYANGWMVASSSYWASRAYLRAGHKSKIKPLVKKAARYKHSFYGVIANYALGNQSAYNWQEPKLTKKKFSSIVNTDEGRRANKLIQAGRYDLAEQELKTLRHHSKKSMKEALAAFAHHHNLAGLSYKIGHALKTNDQKFYDVALYPETGWDIEGYKVDRALINAIIRQESRFQSTAKNASGATGLMQLMPKTARYIANKNGHGLANKVNRLHEPKINIAFGQDYLHYLLNHRVVGQDLLSLAIAYNAGPGTLSKWKREYAHIDDPLLFIEVIPFGETRAFVERVMANFWLYRMRYDQKLHSLDDIAEGRWARYVAQDRDLIDVAWR